MKKLRSFVPTLRNIAVLIGIAFSLISCNALEDRSLKNEGHFRFAMLDSSKIPWAKGHIDYTWDTLWPLLKKAYPSAIVHSIKETDIESYDWTQQTITLTTEGSDTLLDAIACPSTKRSYPYFCLTRYQFVVALNDLPIYGGDFTEIGSARVIRYPFIYPNLANGKVVFTINGLDSIIKDERIKTIFSRLGKLTE